MFGASSKFTEGAGPVCFLLLHQERVPGLLSSCYRPTPRARKDGHQPCALTAGKTRTGTRTRCGSRMTCFDRTKPLQTGSYTCTKLFSSHSVFTLTIPVNYLNHPGGSGPWQFCFCPPGVFFLHFWVVLLGCEILCPLLQDRR